MVEVLMLRMRITVLRHSMHGSRAIWMGIFAVLGLLATAVTVWFAFLALQYPSAAVELLSVASLCWLLGWIVGPVLGSSDEMLRVEQFQLLPLSSLQLTAGLLSASFLGIGPIVTLIAFFGLVIYAFPSGGLPMLVALIVAILQWACTIMLSRVILEALHTSTRSRLSTELSALLLGLLLAFSFTGWTLFPAIGSIWRILGGQPAPAFSTLLMCIPSSWGAIAVSAAKHADWSQTFEALSALLALCLLLFFFCNTLFRRHMIARTHPSQAIISSQGLHRVLPASPLWAVVEKELMTWLRDSWRARFLRMGWWVSVFTCLIPVISGWFFLLPWMGAFMIVIAGIPAGNSYALDGSALWLLLVTPNTGRTDIRGRQIAWLLLIAPVALLLTVVLTLVSGQMWAWPWVLSIVPAMLAGTAGLFPFISLWWLVPLTEPGKRGGSPLLTGSDPGQITLQMRLMMLLIILIPAPAALVVFAGLLLHLPALSWLGIPVGLLTGVFIFWWGGHAAALRLESHGPELLNKMRHGAAPRLKTRKQSPALPQSKAMVVGLLILCALLLVLPQGIVPLILTLVGVHTRGWFVALYISELWQIPASIASIMFGVAALAAATFIVWKHRNARTSAD